MTGRKQWVKGSREEQREKSREQCYGEKQKEEIKVRKEERDYIIVITAHEKII